MSETIYIATVVYFFFVVEKVEGDCIVALINELFGIDFSKWHRQYVGYRNQFLSALCSITPKFA